MGHPFAKGEPVYDVTFENVQAGLRTDYLFRLANHAGGLVVGTGDLSELALGWCTYGVGDQMSHYDVNAGVPKTLIQHLIRWVIGNGEVGPEEARTLQAVLDTEISPELVPVDPDDSPQSTEATIGPYALQDFNLFYTLRYGFRPSKIAFLALHAWSDRERGSWPPDFPEAKRVAYDLPEIRRWLGVFLTRFFGFSQFKRSALPERPEGLGRRLAVAAGRLACAVRRVGPHLDRGAGLETSPKLDRHKLDRLCHYEHGQADSSQCKILYWEDLASRAAKRRTSDAKLQPVPAQG